MNFDIQAPGIDFMVIVPALIVIAPGLLLGKRLLPWGVAPVALLPGLVLVFITLVDEGHYDVRALTHLPFGWFVWTVLSLPGVILGFVVLFLLRLLRRRPALSD